MADSERFESIQSIRFERIAFVDGAFRTVAVVDVVEAEEDGKVYAWRVGEGPLPMVLGGPFESIQHGYEWSRQLRWSANTAVTPKPRKSPAGR